MVKRDFIKIRNFLLRLLDKKGIEPFKIVIFGSSVVKKLNECNDIDIIIVSKNFRDKNIFEIIHQTEGIHWELVKKFDKPFDILYYSDKDWEKGQSLIIDISKEKGKIIYG